MLAGLERGILFEKVSQVDVGLELVGIRIRVLAFSEFLDSIASNLEILLLE